jgi:MYXO-CTERM domain-containing protein
LFTGNAAACVCESAPLEDRLDRADAAIIGRVVADRGTSIRGAPQTLLTVEVDQRVKGDVEDTLVVRSPALTDCDLDVPRDQQVGLLLTRAPGGDWLGSACSVVDPGQLVAEGGEPRGGPIKVVVGVAILAVVLLWAFRRRRRGARPDLPGAPEP